MKITVKVRFNASKEKCERFGNNMYLVYLPFEEDKDGPTVLISFLSKNLGIPASRIEYSGRNSTNDWIFEII